MKKQEVLKKKVNDLTQGQPCGATECREVRRAGWSESKEIFSFMCDKTVSGKAVMKLAVLYGLETVVLRKR